jgi:hypothetical protein
MMKKRFMNYCSMIAMLALLLQACMVPALAQSTDFSQNVGKTAANSIRITFTPSAPSTTQILHFVSPALYGGAQQNVNMNNAGSGVYSYDISGLAAGNTLTYSFTYTKNGLQYDSARFPYVFDTVPTDTPPDFGPNVTIFDPSMSPAAIQQVLSNTFTKQEKNQFGSERYAFMFKPGYYEADANLGFYTHVMGLGLSPDDVRIKGEVHIEALWEGNGNATQNFWRAAENLSVTPSKTMRWAAAQAVPFRRMHINGSMILSYYGWASGGYIADSKIDNVYSSAQQQWITRNSDLTSWYDSVWNMVFVGVNNAPANTFPNPPMTTVAQTPVVREKPFLYIDSAGKYNVFVPALRSNSKGASWTGGSTAGSSLPISQFYIVRADNGSAANINAALAQGKHLLFTPGVYHLNDTIRITRANTVVLGIGMATLIPDNGVVAMSVADIDGVKLAGLLFDAGTVSSPALLQVGPGSSTSPAGNVSHAANPSSLSDIFMRVGGTGALGKVQTGLIINSNNVIGDHFWLWRADHGQNVGWTQNTADTGLIVNGKDVTLYGLFVEHFQKHNVLWNGNGGRTYFFQNELPYDPPNQAAWMNGGANGYAAYKVNNAVTTHEGWGMGSYCYFNLNPTVNLSHAYEVPSTAGVKFHNLTTVSLGGVGSITNVINQTDGTADKAKNVATWVNFP